ncbi:uncharacterized protein Z518_03575 [Rhinocladiella mackenziei CBS 650.93]|uniref:Cytochrome P450 n=1 Tax=Rhinocladiella mackenziei CBS 650.93 TaxID=1442369 RepID=A0A0D2HEB8_9EURO|nr:uncharacterized protein Z518_03575 [Rhinocladiella mackenziei CBS 650.93]KIX08918.1 hypothetical protein Z518_03575 [Rhinocladiella mackenziei CBS 650.93]
MFSERLTGILLAFAQKLTVTQAFLFLLALFLALQVLLTIYRLLFHPLARFPGPKLAGISYWYEYYYDVSKKGRFIWKIMELHERYGPVVRINPNELHFNDPEFYDEIYHGKKMRTDRDRWFNLDHLGQGLAFTIDHDLHARRRHALSPYFSMQSIRALEPRITDVVRLMVDRLHEAHKSGTVLNLYYLFSGYALDIVSEYAFGKDISMKFMSNPEFGKLWANLTAETIQINNFGRQFKWLMVFMMSLPESIMIKLNPKIARLIDWRGSIVGQVRQVLDEKLDEKPKDEPTTVIRELVGSDLPPEDKTLQRLSDEANMVVGAGGETTAQTLTRTFYHLLQSPRVMERLRKELNAAIPSPMKIPSLATLQNLPYLNAVVDEGVRISFPVPARSPRIFRDHALQYGEWTIKPGTSVSMSPWMVSMSEKIFPEPFKFKPERWLGNKELRKYQVTFGKGKRACLGINLAYTEMLFAVAMIVRNFELELYETTWEDVEIVHDFFMALPKASSRSVRVEVTKELS